MKKGIISKLLTALLVVGLLFSILPSQLAQAATTVSSQAELVAALAGTETVIELGASFGLTSTVNIDRSVTIDGKNFTITGPSTYHAINVNADNVTIQNLTITGTADGHNLQFYVAKGGVLTNVVLSNGGKSGMTVNGSEVTISGVTTTNNAWGGINVDQGSGVTAIPKLTVSGPALTTHTSPSGTITPAIWVDKGNAGWVSAPVGYAIVPGTPLSFFDNAEFLASSLAGTYPVHNVTKNFYYTTIQAAVAGAEAGDVINVAAGTYVIDSQITIDEAIKLQGQTGAKIQVSGTGHRFLFLAGGTLSGFEIEKTDKTGQNIIGIQSSNVTISNNVIHGQYVMGDNDPASRAMEISAGISNLSITGNTIYSLRQPAYVNGPVNGVVQNNNVYNTRGWVLAGGHLVFTDNTWGDGTLPNAVDIAIIVDNPPFTGEWYTDIPAMSAANNNALIHDQRPGAGLSDAYVDASAPTGQNCYPVTPCKTIAEGIAKVAPGGTVHVGAGTYTEKLTIDKALTLQSTNWEGKIVGPGAGLGGIDIKASNVTLKGLDISNPSGNGINISNDQATPHLKLSNISILNNKIHDIGDDLGGNTKAIKAAHGPDNVTIEGNQFYNIDNVGPGRHVDAISIGDSGSTDPCENLIIRNNTFANISGKGDGKGVNAISINNNTSTKAVIEGNSFEVDTINNTSATGYVRVIDLGRSTPETVIRNNTFLVTNPANVNPSIIGINFDSNPGAASVAIEKNKFLGGGYPLINAASYAVDASPNWWGKADGPADGSIVGDVAYLPYCTNEGCTEFSKAGLYMTPDTVGTTDTCTGTQTVEVYVQDVAWLTAYEIEVLFNPALVEVTAVTNGGWLDPDGTPPPGPYIDNVNGKINFGWAAFGGGDGLSKPSTGTGSLMKITFRARNLAGTSAFTINAANTLLVGWEPGNEGMPIEFDVTGSASVTYGSIVTNVTKIPEVSYCNLATAVTQATAGDTLRADKDFTTTAQVNVTKNLTFDTNGHTITRVNASSAYDAVFQVRTVHLTITGGGTINSTSSSGDFGAAIYMWAGNATGATVTLEDATLSGKNTSVYVTAGAHSITGVIYPAVYNMTGGTVTDGIFVIRPAAELNITGGTVKGFAPIQGNGSAGMGGTKITIGGTAVIDGDDSIAIYHPQNGELTINGGTIIGTNAIEMKAGKLVVTDGTITGTGPFVETPTAISGYSTDTGDAILLFSAAGYTGDLSVDIQGGTITSDKAYALREFTTEATTRTKSIKVSDGTLNGGLGTDNADEAVFFSTVDPTVLQLTGGRYNTDPGDSPDYVYEPLDTYLHTDDYYHIMGIVAGTFEPFPADGLVIGPETITDTINYSGAIPWYNAAPTLNRVQGNRVGMKVIEPEGVDLTGATIKIYRDGIQYYTGGWNASKDAASDNFVPYWALVTNIPQDYKIVVNWNAVSEQTFFAHVLEGSTLVAPPAPIISSTDIQGYYLAGDVREFNVSMKNPDLGANYALMIFDYKLAGVTTADIDSFEYLAPPGDPRAGQWVVMTDSGYETYADCTDGTGVCGQFGWAPGGFGPVPAGFENTSKFRIKFNKGFAAPLAFTLDLSGKLDVADADWTLLTTYNGSLDVHDKPVITVVTDPYFIVNEEGKFSVTIANPATGRNYGNNVVFDLVIPGHLPADFESMSCGFGGTTWPVTLQADGNGGSITRIGGLDGFFNITAPFGPMTVNCTVTLKTSGEYSVTGKMTDTLATPELTDDRIIQTSSGEVKAYTKPTITATFPTGPIAAGVPVTVPVTITNPDGLPGPFGLVLDLPDGATIVYGGATYLCGDDPLTEDVVEVGCPVIPVDAPLTAGELVITFPGNGTVDVTIELFDTAADPDRKLADTTITDVVIGGDYAVTGYFWLQGTSRRHDIPVTFTWGGTLAPYGPTIDTEDTDTVNLTATLTYGGEYLITTNQPRYLNVTAGLGKTFEVKGQTSLNSLRLLAGNAIWLDNVIDNKDSGHVGAGYNDGIAARPDADVNFDGRINIQDLALVGGNYGLDSDVYDSWVVVTP